MVEPRWIRTDPASDLLNSVEHCLLTFRLALSDERNWKWCVAAAHSAAQSAMVFVLDKAGQYEHFEPKSRRELIAYLNESSENPKKKYPKYLHLATFIDLYRACKKHLPKDVATPELYRDLERLNDLRNHWTHFKVNGWSLEVSLVRIATLAGIRLVDQLPLYTSEYQYSKIDAARYDIAISSLVRLLSIADIDTIQPENIDAQAVEILSKLDSDTGTEM